MIDDDDDGNMDDMDNDGVDDVTSDDHENLMMMMEISLYLCILLSLSLHIYIYIYDCIGFEWRLRDHTHKQQVVEDKFTQVFEGLKIYKRIVDESLQIPTSYVIPIDSEDWPEELRGIRLGALVQGNEMYEVMNVGMNIGMNVGMNV